MGFRMVIDSQPDLSVVGEAGNGAEAIAAVARLQPGGRADGRAHAGDGRRRGDAPDRRGRRADARIIILTTFDLDEYVYAALRAGASGFLLKDAQPADLLSAVRAVAAGEAVVAPRVTRRLLESYGHHLPATGAAGGAGSASRERLEQLTARELEVLRARRARTVERRDRREVRALRGDREDARRPDPGQARAARSRADRRLRLRERPDQPIPRLIARTAGRRRGLLS